MSEKVGNVPLCFYARGWVANKMRGRERRMTMMGDGRIDMTTVICDCKVDCELLAKAVLKSDGMNRQEMRDFVFQHGKDFKGLRALLKTKSISQSEMDVIADQMIRTLEIGNIIVSIADGSGRFAVTSVAADYL